MENSLEHSEIPTTLVNAREFGALPTAEIVDIVDVKDTRAELIDSALAPYHLHFSKEIEGEALSPESAELNFDTLLLLTQMIRGKFTSRNKMPENEKYISWFFEKHSSTGIRTKDLYTPKKVVSLWLEKLGPHNDLVGAEPDFLEARSWLISEVEAKKLGQDEAEDLIIELDSELVEMLDSESRSDLRREAIELLERKISRLEQKEFYVDAALSKMKQTALKIESIREMLSGTNQLTTSMLPEKYDDFEEYVEASIFQLASYVNTCMVGVDQNVKEYIIAPEDNLLEFEKAESKYSKATSMFFEPFTYISIMLDVIESGELSRIRVRPGTLREESSTSHKVDYFPNSQQLNGNNDSKRHGFNYNYDLQVTQLNENGPILSTTYIQNKLSPFAANPEKAAQASVAFFGNKQFRYFLPSDILSLTPHNTRRGVLLQMNNSMKTWLQNTFEL